MRCNLAPGRSALARLNVPHRRPTRSHAQERLCLLQFREREQRLRSRPSIEAAHAVAAVSLGNVGCAVRARGHHVGRTIFVCCRGRDTDTGSHFDIRPGRLLERATQLLGASLRHPGIHAWQHDAEFLAPETGGGPSWPIWSRMMASACTGTRSPAG